MHIDQSVLVNRPIEECEAAIAVAPRRWFPRLDARSASSVGPRVGGLPVRTRVAVELGKPMKAGGWTNVPLRWKAKSASHLFPVMTGRIELVPVENGITRLTVSGTYEPPLGKIGKQLDHALMHSVAQRTITELAESIADRLRTPASPPDRPSKVPDSRSRTGRARPKRRLPEPSQPKVARMTIQGFSRILLATDATAHAEAAAHVVAAIAKPAGASVRIVHCWNLEIHHRHGIGDVELRSEAEGLIGEAVSRLQDLDINTEGQLMRADTDHVEAAIAEAAREFDADLLVVGSSGLSDWRSMFEHEVSHQALAAINCPVLIVREDPASLLGEPLRVLVAIAGGDDITPVVRAAIAAASTPGSRVLIADVPQGHPGSRGSGDIDRDEVPLAIEAAAAMLHDAGIPNRSKSAEAGPVAHAVARLAWQWQADVIVIASSRMSELASSLLASVTRDLLRAAKGPYPAPGAVKAPR